MGWLVGVSAACCRCLAPASPPRLSGRLLHRPSFCCNVGSLDPQESCYIHEEETLQLRLAEVEFLTSQTDILEKLTKLVALIRLRQRAVSHRISFLVKRIRLVSEALEQVIQGA